MISAPVITIINNIRGGTFSEDGLWLVIGTLALAAVAISALEWRRRVRSRSREGQKY